MTMADKFTKASRFVLYGADTWNMSKKKPTMRDWAWGIAQNYLRSRFGLHTVSAPGLVDFLRTHVTEWITDWMGVADNQGLPQDWPKKVFKTIDEVVKARGGTVELSGGLKVPAFSLDAKSALSLRTLWLVNVPPVNESCDFEKIKKSERAIENALYRSTGKKYNIRILDNPEHIEIDNPEPPMIRLADHWQRFLNGDIGPKRYALGIEAKPEGEMLQVNRLDDTNEFSIAYFGRSGSGKTQAMLSAMLTVCAGTSPSDLSVVVVDPKAMDFPVDGLPHLAKPVINDPEEAREMVLEIVKEMDRRVQRKDRQAAQKRILLVIDELADLLQVQQGDELTAGLLRLAQKGRAWGFSMMLGSQRAVNESFPRNIHTQIPARWVGNVLNSAEAGFAAGMESDAHKLPGKGAAMIYEPSASAVRIQSLFVADAKDPKYAKLVKPFIDDICGRWAGKVSHWNGKAYDDPKPPAEQAEQPQSEAKPMVQRLTIDEQEELLALLNKDQYDAILEHCKASDSLSRRKMREIIGSRFSEAKEKALHAALLAHFDMV